MRQDELRQVLDRLADDLDGRAEVEGETTVPAFSKQFSGRQAELLDLFNRLKDDHAGVICGLGGVGKTELAFAYAHAFAMVYPGGRFLIECAGKSTLRDAVLGTDKFTQLEFIRNNVSDGVRMQPDAYFAANTHSLRGRLNERGNILLVLDNVTDAELLLPQEMDRLTALGPMLHILGTTSLPASRGRHIAWVTLGELSATEALMLLEKHRSFTDDTERKAAQQIVERLRGFALAIKLAGAWLAAHESATYAGLADSLELDALDIIAEDHDVELRWQNHQRRLHAVLDLILVQLTVAERLTLACTACLPADHVPLPWLRDLVVARFPELSQAGGPVDPWQELRDRLLQLAILKRADEADHQSRLVCVHRVVHDLFRRKLSPQDLSAAQQGVEAIVAQRNSVMEKTIQWDDIRWELEPLTALANLWADTEHPKAAWLLSQSGQHWTTLAEWARAELLMRRALSFNEQSDGVDHPKVAAQLNNLAMLLRSTNRLGEAELLLRRALAILDQAFGLDQANVIHRIDGNLINLLRTTDRLTEDKPHLDRALTVDVQSYKAEHPDTASCLVNLALVFQETNRLAEAEPLMRRALAFDEQYFGGEHANVARDLNSLARLLQETQRVSEAESLFRRALDIYEQSDGANHPNVAMLLNNLAALLQSTNCLEEAEPLFRRALAIDEQCYGTDHPNVACDLNNLAVVLHSTDRFEQAEPLYRRALAIDEQFHGANHPEVGVRLNNLSQILQSTSRLEEAKPLTRRMVAIFLNFENKAGHRHPHLQAAVNNYARLLRKMGYTDAEVHQELIDLFAENDMSHLLE